MKHLSSFTSYFKKVSLVQSDFSAIYFYFDTLIRFSVITNEQFDL